MSNLRFARACNCARSWPSLTPMSFAVPGMRVLCVSRQEAKCVALEKELTSMGVDVAPIVERATTDAEEGADANGSS